MLKINSKGQTLIEMIVVISVGVLVVGGLVFTTISSLRNANFAKNAVQVTKLAQEGLERVRSIRDQDGNIGTFTYIRDGNQYTATKFSDLYQAPMYANCNPCNFSLNLPQNGLIFNSPPEVKAGFTRKVQITDVSSGQSWQSEKNITVIVSWTDPTGPHESKLTTILIKK